MVNHCPVGFQRGCFGDARGRWCKTPGCFGGSEDNLASKNGSCFTFHMVDAYPFLVGVSFCKHTIYDTHYPLIVDYQGLAQQSMCIAYAQNGMIAFLGCRGHKMSSVPCFFQNTPQIIRCRAPQLYLSECFAVLLCCLEEHEGTVWNLQMSPEASPSCFLSDFNSGLAIFDGYPIRNWDFLH